LFMDWVSLLLSLGLFGVLLTLMIDIARNAYEVRRNKGKFLQSVKKELEECHSLLNGEGKLLPTDMWKSGISTGSLKLISYEDQILLARVYFRIECHNYEAEKVRDVSILAASEKGKPQKLVKIETVMKQSPAEFYTYSELLHWQLSLQLRESEKILRSDIDSLLKRQIWN